MLFLFTGPSGLYFPIAWLFYPTPAFILTSCSPTSLSLKVWAFHQTVSCLPTWLTFVGQGDKKKKSWICADKSLKSLSYSVPHLFLWQPCSIGSNHMGKWSMQKLSNLSKDIQLDVLHTKQTALSWNVIDYLGGGRWGGTISPIRNKIEKYIPFVSCHKKPWKERRSSKCSDLDLWNMAWVEYSSWMLPQVPQPQGNFLFSYLFQEYELSYSSMSLQCLAQWPYSINICWMFIKRQYDLDEWRWGSRMHFVNIVLFIHSFIHSTMNDYYERASC